MAALRYIVIMIVFSVLIAPRSSFPATEVRTLERTGADAVMRFYRTIQKKDWVKAEELLDKGFQSVRDDGTRDYYGEMEYLKGLDLGTFHLSGLKATESDNVLVVTYDLLLQVMKDGAEIPAVPVRMITVFIENGDEWQAVSSAEIK